MHRSGSHRVALAAASALLAVAAIGCGQGDAARLALPEITAVPLEELSPSTVAAAGTASEAATPEPTDEPTATGEATEAPVELPREPDDGDRGAFISGYQPEGASDVDALAADVDRDGTSEVVVTYVQGGQVQLDIAWWDGLSYVAGTMLDGGPATTVTRTIVRDVNRDGLTEIVAEFAGTGDTGGLSIWRVSGRGQVTGLIAVGGCHSGRSTYGVVGARLEDRDGDGADEIYATCDDSPLAQADWTTDRYVWDGGSYRHLPPLDAADAPGAPGAPDTSGANEAP